MKRATMLYASPFWPLKSGISNYSSCLLQVLKKYYDISLLVDGYTVEDPMLAGFPKIKYRKGAEYRRFDIILYNIGNQPDYHGYMLEAMKKNPGFIILHDFSLYYLVVGVAQHEDRVFEMIYQEAGIDGVQLVKDSLKSNKNEDLLQHKNLADKLPLNYTTLSTAKGIFVHSEFSKKRIQQIGVNTNIWKMNHLTTFVPSKRNYDEDIRIKRQAQANWGIPEDAFLLVAAGFIAPSKQNSLTCQAVGQYNAKHSQKIYYLMVGEGSDADLYLSQYCIKTGFVSNELYELAIARADMIFNLRYPTNGETSGTLIQAMQLGKPCVTTAIGWFDELPDNTVIKVAPTVTKEELVAILENQDKEYLRTLGQRAEEYAEKECNPEYIAEYMVSCLQPKA